MIKLWHVAALVLVFALGGAFLTVARAGYENQVNYMTEFCRAEAQAYIYKAKGELVPINCVMRFWDGGLAFFDVAGTSGLKFSCYADEANWFPQKLERCEFS